MALTHSKLGFQQRICRGRSSAEGKADQFRAPERLLALSCLPSGQAPCRVRGAAFLKERKVLFPDGKQCAKQLFSRSPPLPPLVNLRCAEPHTGHFLESCQRSRLGICLWHWHCERQSPGAGCVSFSLGSMGGDPLGTLDNLFMNVLSFSGAICRDS